VSSLTETARVSRKAIRYGGIGLVVITLAWYLMGGLIQLYYILYPPPKPPPTVPFGILSNITFPAETGVRPKMTLELPTGRLPAFPDRMYIYSAPTKRSGFADPERAIETASAMGFLFRPDQPTESRYVFTLQDQLNSRLDYNIISGHFLLNREWQKNPALLNLNFFMSERQIITDTSNFLNRAGLLRDDMVGVEKITYLKADAGKLISALSLSDADFVQVDYFRKNVDEFEAGSEKKNIVASYPFYRPDPNKGLVRVIMSGSKEPTSQIITADYQYVNVRYEDNGTYPIKTGEMAWEELVNGDGFVTSQSLPVNEVKIRRVFLAYYDSDQGQDYTMPIYVFLGDQGFAAYVSAVTDDWTED
jgi:hypothetical protein